MAPRDVCPDCHPHRRFALSTKIPDTKGCLQCRVGKSRGMGRGGTGVGPARGPLPPLSPRSAEPTHGQHLPAGRNARQPAPAAVVRAAPEVSSAEGAGSGMEWGGGSQGRCVCVAEGVGGRNGDLSTPAVPRISPAPCPAQQGCWSPWCWTGRSYRRCAWGPRARRGPAAVSSSMSCHWRLA